MQKDHVRPSGFGSFGAPEPPDPVNVDDGAQPVPVLHVGEVHAELRLHITGDTLTELGSQIASMLAQATKQGFEAGIEAAMSDADPAALDVLGGQAPHE